MLLKHYDWYLWHKALFFWLIWHEWFILSFFFFFCSNSVFPTVFHLILTEFLTLQKELAHRSMHRSYSVPEIREDGTVSLHGNIDHLIPTSPQMGQEIVLTPCKSPAYDNGKFIMSFRVSFGHISKILLHSLSAMDDHVISTPGFWEGKISPLFFFKLQLSLYALFSWFR